MITNFRSFRNTCLQLVMAFVLFSNSATAWVTPPSLGVLLNNNAKNCHQQTALFYSSEFGPNNNSTSSVVERLKVNGVSVSPKGFHVLLESTTGGGRSSSSSSSKTPQEATTEQAKQQEKETQDSTTTASTPTANSKNVLLPLKMTNDPADAFCATSPESLTLCQLLSGVDMAGAILPPELLQKIVACHIEDKIETLYDDDDDDDDDQDDLASIFTPVLTPIEMKLWEFLQNQQAMMREQSLFGGSISPDKEAIQAQMQMPQVMLDQLTLVPLPSASWQCKLECAIPEWKENIVVTVKPDLLASLAYNYDPESSPLFTCIALALRYKAPIVLEQTEQQEQPTTTTTTTTEEETSSSSNNNNNFVWSTNDDLDRDFPQRTSVENLQEQSTRVTQNIEKGFEIHKLTGALQIAMRLGDTKAAEKIRAKLDEYDSMEELPTLGSSSKKEENDTTSTTSTTTTSEPAEDDRLDDLENNILQ
eukprot:CAMPEP_0116132334 /NCGR_PEP_ID=MMETSP0329-20121206/9489_1 /TAXON_ID=697910 /ORGANISM="Pseudo-nitzschia arenysensis, Strain B593" /LENGTH=476 /DNA_ID=CAMNT_0003626835 /DNA_START=88 /DNA_END=1518 /DNA_ORIENTATION=+